ncbi:hypothetical protein [Chitinimonas sp. BJYL2]|uniref:hypothetical protein n=1 Tax=Chitinimonas sp. BJYL2 TaxID=2976696 RepID=UPI0022B51F2A|nr:hypothetical protein [Chitinimonas sp. BJYL2]
MKTGTRSRILQALQRVLAWLTSLAALLLAAIAAYSLLSTLWRQLAYGGDAYGSAWARIGLQAGLLVLAGMLWWGLRRWRLPPLR